MDPNFTPIGYSFTEWRRLDPGRALEERKKFWQANRSYFEGIYAKHEWAVVLGSSGRVFAYGDNLNDFPSQQEKIRIGIETNEVPVPFTKPREIKIHHPSI
jgi:hypothetical protein